MSRLSRRMRQQSSEAFERRNDPLIQPAVRCPHFLLIVSVVVAGAGVGCDTNIRLPPVAPSAAPSTSVVPDRTPVTFPSISVGQPVRFQFTSDDPACVGVAGRCRSYTVTAPSNGQLEVVLRSVSGEQSFLRETEMYVVPGGDYWIVGPGPQIGVSVPAKAGSSYEIRMYSPTVPSLEFELRATLKD